MAEDCRKLNGFRKEWCTLALIDESVSTFIGRRMSDRCVFCRIIAGGDYASIIYRYDLTMSFVDLRQVNAGYVLVGSGQDIRDLDAVGRAISALPRIDRNRNSGVAARRSSTPKA
jgi:hypothetical protein